MAKAVFVTLLCLIPLAAQMNVAVAQPADRPRDLARELVVFGGADVLGRKAAALADAQDRRVLSTVIMIIGAQPDTVGRTSEEIAAQVDTAIAQAAAAIGTHRSASVSRCLRESCDEAHVRFGPQVPSASDARRRIDGATSRRERLAMLEQVAAETRDAFMRLRAAQARIGISRNLAVTPNACARLADLLAAMKDAASEDGKSGGERPGSTFNAPRMGEAGPKYLQAIDTMREMGIYLESCRKVPVREHN